MQTLYENELNINSTNKDDNCYMILIDTDDQNNSFWKFSFIIAGINYILKYIKREQSFKL